MPCEAPLLVGSTTPRLWTQPLVELTPETSYGFAVIEFADKVLGAPLDPWEEWLAIHLGELLPDGRPRFRQALILVARQNGKTFLLTVLALYWQFAEQWRLIVGMSTNLEYAREAWEGAVDLATSVPALAGLVPKNGIRRVNGEHCLTSSDRCRYRIAASNRKGGRSLSIDRLIVDELREHATWAAYNAAYNAMNARPLAQAVYISNQGDDSSVVLDSLRKSALKYIDHSSGDPRLGLFEWSAPDGADLLDPAGWCAANPSLGLRVDVDAIRGAAERAADAGGEEEAGFRTEVLCQRVHALRVAIDPAAWSRCLDPGDLSAVRRRVALCLDIAPDGLHATIAAAAVLPDGRTRIELVGSWSGARAVDEMRTQLRDIVTRIRPAALGWYPGGPGAAFAGDVKITPTTGKAPRTWLERLGVTVAPISADTPAVCMGLAQQVTDTRIAHSGDPLLDTQIAAAERKPVGDRWVLVRSGAGHVDAVYAAAGSEFLARTMPPSPGRPRVITARGG